MSKIRVTIKVEIDDGWPHDSYVLQDSAFLTLPPSGGQYWADNFLTAENYVRDQIFKQLTGRAEP